MDIECTTIKAMFKPTSGFGWEGLAALRRTIEDNDDSYFEKKYVDAIEKEKKYSEMEIKKSVEEKSKNKFDLLLE